MRGRLFRRSAALVLALALLVPGHSGALEAGVFSLRPGERGPRPRQRTLAEVEKIPEKILACPVCGTDVAAPVADLMVRRPPSLGENDPTPKWRMFANDYDADLCPYPEKGFLSWQADIVLCPDCGYANAFDAFPLPVPAEAAAWVEANLKPELRTAQRALVGKRADAMTEEELIAFFNRQDVLPDAIRTEHYRTYLAAVHAPALEQAEAAWLAAWAARRETVAAPKSELFAKRAAAFAVAMEKIRRNRPGLPGDIDAVRSHTRRLRQGKTGLPDADNMTGRVILAGFYVRLGFLDDAEQIYENLFVELRERFLRNDQDPLWAATSTRAPVSQRLNELELLRADAEKEIFIKAELVRRERGLLFAAADRIRDAFRNGDLDGKKDEALFHAYLVGEFLRRGGDLPLASEWFKNLLNIAGAETPLAQAATTQLRFVGEEAGDKVNLLSALGKDGELFAKLREICRGRE